MNAPKHASHFTTTALVLGVWFMGSVCGQCFFNSTGHSRELGFADFIARNNPSRLSTKNPDEESDLLFYGYRYYNPSTGRWLSRDPVGEGGGLNLLNFLDNSPISNTDSLGLFYMHQQASHYWINAWALLDLRPRLLTGPQTIYVEKCEIVIFVGHGVRQNGEVQPHRFIMPKGCAAAGFVGCWAGFTNGNLEEDGRTRNNIPRHQLLEGAPDWDDTREGDVYYNLAEDRRRMDQAIETMRNDAKKRARDMLSDCCKTVFIHEIWAVDKPPWYDRAAAFFHVRRKRGLFVEDLIVRTTVVNRALLLRQGEQ